MLQTWSCYNDDNCIDTLSFCAQSVTELLNQIKKLIGSKDEKKMYLQYQVDLMNNGEPKRQNKAIRSPYK